MTAREAIARMLDSADDSVPLLCARRIKQFEGWNITDEEARHRLRQALNGTARRHFEIDWFPVLQDIFVRYDVPDLVTPLIYDARRDAESDLRAKSREMRTVRPERRSVVRRIS